MYCHRSVYGILEPSLQRIKSRLSYLTHERAHNREFWSIRIPSAPKFNYVNMRYRAMLKAFWRPGRCLRVGIHRESDLGNARKYTYVLMTHDIFQRRFSIKFDDTLSNIALVRTVGVPTVCSNPLLLLYDIQTVTIAKSQPTWLVSSQYLPL